MEIAGIHSTDLSGWQLAVYAKQPPNPFNPSASDGVGGSWTFSKGFRMYRFRVQGLGFRV